MKNEQKYNTAEERVKAFGKFCEKQGENCNGCPYDEIENNDDRFSNCVIGFAHWLALEAEDEKPEPCPFCGSECKVIGEVNHRVRCSECNYESIMGNDKGKIIAAHNRVVRAVRAAVESEVQE